MRDSIKEHRDYTTQTVLEMLQELDMDELIIVVPKIGDLIIEIIELREDEANESH